MYFIVGMNINIKITVKARYGHEQMPSERTVSIPVHAMKAYSGSGGIAPFSLNFDARWK